MSLLARGLIRRGLNMASAISRLNVRGTQSSSTTGFDKMTYPALDNLRKFKEPPEIERKRLFWVIRAIAANGILFVLGSIVYYLTFPRLFFPNGDKAET